MPSTVKSVVLKDKNGAVVYPVTDVALISGLGEGAWMACIMAWDGTAAPVVANIPAGVQVTYDGNSYTGTLAASANTAGKVYLVNTGTNTYARYLTTGITGSYVWSYIGSTEVQSVQVVDNLQSIDATKALSARQGRTLNLTKPSYEVAGSTPAANPLTQASKEYVQSLLLQYYTKEQVDVIMQTVSFPTFIIAWDGTVEPVVANIPAGVVINYNNTDYTGTLAASNSTAGHIYLVKNGATYDMYVTVQGSTYAWALIGTTAVNLTIVNNLTTDDATQALSAAMGVELAGQVSQLEAKLIEIREHGENHYYIRSSGGTYSWYSAGDTMLSRYVKVLPGDTITVVKNSDRDAYIAFVASVDTSLTPVFANGTSSINAAVSNQTFQVTEECYFWWMVQYNTSQLYEPSVLTLNGQSILNGIYRVDKLSNIEQELAAIQQENAPNVYTYGEVLGGYFNTDGTWRTYNANCQYVELKAGDKVHIKGGHDYGSRIAFVSGDVVVGTTLVFANGTSAAITLNSEEEKDYNIIEDCNLVWIGEITFSALNIQDWNPESVLVNGISYDGTWKEQIAKNTTDLAALNKDDSEIMSIVINSNIAKYYQKGASPKSFQSEKKIAILCAGQSNAEGRVPYADMPAEIKSAQPIANCHYVEDSVSGAFSSLNITGLWAFDLVTYYNLCVTANKEIYVMKWAEGGTSIDPLGDSTNHWTADYEKLSSENNSLLRKFETEIRNHIATDGENFAIRAMLWHQGEGDRGSLGTGSADRYYENLRNMVSYIRGIVGNERLPFITGTISHNSAQYDAEIEAAQQRIASEDPYFCLIDMSGAPLLDSYHFNAASSVYFGEMAYNALIDFGVLSATKLTPTRPW